jgi:hypothetical protein
VYPHTRRRHRTCGCTPGGIDDVSPRTSGRCGLRTGRRCRIQLGVQWLSANTPGFLEVQAESAEIEPQSHFGCNPQVWIGVQGTVTGYPCATVHR